MNENVIDNNFYGVAWNFDDDTYRRTGLLTNIKEYKDVEKIMFIHNSIIKHTDGTYKVPKIYYHQRRTKSEIVMEISDIPLPEFEILPLNLIPLTMETIDYGVFKSFDSKNV